MGGIELWTAFSIGLLGSVHCVGMCGPIALALPYQGMSKWQAAKGVLAYNSGRITTYALLGAVIGLLGKGIWIAGLQTYLVLAVGILLAVIALFSISVESHLLRIPAIQRLNRWVSMELGKRIRTQGMRTSFAIGVLNGLIPCGLVYMAIAGALANGTIPGGAVFMALFGLGTIPLMALTALMGQAINVSWRTRLRRLAPLLMLAIAALFIFRGLQFQVPNDLRFWEAWQTMPMCH